MFLLAVALIVFLPIVASMPIYVAGIISKRIKYLTVLTVTIINFVTVISLFPKVKNHTLSYTLHNLLGIDISFKLNLVAFIFVFITSLAWIIVIIYSKDYVSRRPKSKRFYAFLMITLGATQGVFLSGDLLLLFLFFELMSFASYPLVIHDENPGALKAGKLYLYMAIGGGLILLLGIFMTYHQFETLSIEALSHHIHSLDNKKYIIASLLISGFGVKAGMIPLHIWLPEAHSAAPSPASALLSGILIKGGAFGILVTTLSIFRHDELLGMAVLVIGTITMLSGGLSAIFQVNIKRILAYSSISQMGYILIGIGTALYMGKHGVVAYTGVVYHILNHAFFKVGLFLGIGSIYFRTHELDIRKLGGFGKLLPLTFFVFIIAVAGISGIPGFNGYVSKTLLHEALEELVHHRPNEYMFNMAEKIFVFSSGITFCYLLKLLKEVFLGPLKPKKDYIPEKALPYMLVALGIISIIITGIGLFPNFFLITYARPLLFQIGLMVEVSFLTSLKVFSIHTIKSTIKSLIIGLALFAFIIRFRLMYLELPQWLCLKNIIYIPMVKLFLYVFYHSFGFLHWIIDRSFHFVHEIFLELTHKASEFNESYMSIDDKVSTAKLRTSESLKQMEEKISELSRKIGKKLNSYITETSLMVKNLNIGIIILALIIIMVILLSIYYNNPMKIQQE